MKIKILSILLIALLIIKLASPFALVFAIESPEIPESPGSVETEVVVETPQAPEITYKPEESENENSTENLHNSLDTEADDQLSDNEQSYDSFSKKHLEDSSRNSIDGQTANVSIHTGDSTVRGSLTNSGNQNIAESGVTGGSNNTEIANSNNGASSTNIGSISQDLNSTTNQDNNADLDNGLNLSSDTGNNSASFNVGSSTIQTGDASVTGTIVNNVNTNILGVSVTEFNVLDDQKGDIILNFEDGCIVGCEDGSLQSIQNIGNGTESTNSGEIISSLDTRTTQTNDANVQNELILIANTGENNANFNTGGDNTISTGDASISGNVLNFLNNNIVGKIIYQTVNIFGNLVGDIILPSQYLDKLFAPNNSQTTLTNTGNSLQSTNTAAVSDTQNDINNQSNTARIINDVVLDANTGENKTSGNTGGDNTITTGNADVDAQVINIANLNIVDGNWWVVWINEAGNWVGKILGSPESSSYAASEGINISEQESGSINITNQENGAGSTNTGQVTTQDSQSTTQENNATIKNTVRLFANTGGNSASYNTGGDNTITTGNAQVMLNLVNFLNNNITGNVVFTVVNVFGSWLGDFVPPGLKKEPQGSVNDPANSQPSSTKNNSSGNITPQSSAENGTNFPSNNASNQSDENNIPESIFSETTSILRRTFTVSSNATGEVEGISEEKDTLIAESMESQIQPEKANNKTKINLAWGLLGILIIPLMLLIRKKIAQVKLLSKN